MNPPSSAVLNEWDDLVARTRGTDITQMSIWGSIREMEDYHARWVLAWRDGRLAGGAQILVRHLPIIGRVGYVPYGPVVAEQALHRAEVARELAAKLARLEDVQMLFIQPPEGGQDLHDYLRDQGFRPSTTQVGLWGSIRIDLAHSVDEIRQLFTPRLRSWTRRWSEQGVAVRLGDECDLPLLVRLMQATAAAQGYSAPPRLGYLQHLYAELARKSLVAVFVGEVHGRPVTVDLVTMCGKMVRGRYAGFDRDGPWVRLIVPGAVRWEMIRWAKQAGYRWFDFGGLSDRTLRDIIDLGRKSCDSWPGPDKAKLSFGGEPYRYPAPVELIRPWALRRAYDAVITTELGRRGLDMGRTWMRARRERQAPQPANGEQSDGKEAPT